MTWSNGNAVLAADKEGVVIPGRARVMNAGQDPKELEAAYDGWSPHYTKDVQIFSGYQDACIVATKVLVDFLFCHPTFGHGLFTTNSTSTSTTAATADGDDDDDDDSRFSIIDFGCGPGAAGIYLTKQLGLDTATKRRRQRRPIQVDACDLSSGMLALARGLEEDVYDQFIKADFDRSNCATQRYDIVHASGVFAPNHAPPSTFDEFWRILKTHGLAVFTIPKGYYDVSQEGAAHRQYLDHMVVNQKKWQVLSKTEETYSPNVDKTAYVFVLKKN